MQQPMVVGARQHEIAQLRRTTIRPRADVIPLTMPRRPMTAWESTTAIAQIQRPAQSRRDQPANAPEVERFAVGAEDRGDDLAVAGMQPRLRGRDRPDITEERGTDTGLQVLQ